MISFAHGKLPEFNSVELIARYRAYRLPEPALGLESVVVSDESTVQELGFRDRQGRVATFPWAHPQSLNSFGGTRVDRVSQAQFHRVDPDIRFWPQIAALEMRGESASTQRILRCVFENRQWNNSEFKSPWPWLRQAAWGYWQERAIGHPEERKRLQAWLTKIPTIDGIPFSQSEKSFLKDIEATLSKPEPSNGATKYDDLVEQTITAKGTTLSDYKYGIWPPEESKLIAKPVAQLWEAGFDALPALFRHLNDRRITRLGFDEFDGPMYHRVCDVAADLILTALEGGPDYYANQDRGPSNHRPEKTPDEWIAQVKALRPTWVRLAKKGEANVLVARMKDLDEPEKGALDTVSTNGLRAYPLRVLAKKYRSQLQRFYWQVRYPEEAEQIREALNPKSLAKQAGSQH